MTRPYDILTIWITKINFVFYRNVTWINIIFTHRFVLYLNKLSINKFYTYARKVRRYQMGNQKSLISSNFSPHQMISSCNATAFDLTINPRIPICLKIMSARDCHYYYEWVSDCCLAPNQLFFQLYHDENKLIFNELMMRSALC